MNHREVRGDPLIERLVSVRWEMMRVGEEEDVKKWHSCFYFALHPTNPPLFFFSFFLFYISPVRDIPSCVRLEKINTITKQDRQYSLGSGRLEAPRKRSVIVVVNHLLAVGFCG